MISRRRLHLIITLLLPLLALRVLVPDGYMVTTESGRLRLDICSAGFAGGNPQTPDLHHHHHDQHQHHHGDGGRSPSLGEHCPFAHAAIHAPPPHMLAGVATPAPEFRFVSRLADQLPPPTGPPRQTSARAPPVALV